MRSKFIKYFPLLLLMTLGACFTDPPHLVAPDPGPVIGPSGCEAAVVAAVEFGGEVDAGDAAWDLRPDGSLATGMPGARVAAALSEDTSRVEVYASGAALPTSFVGVSAVLRGLDPATGQGIQLGDVRTTAGPFPPQLQVLELEVPAAARDWPVVLLVVTSTGSPGDRVFTGVKLFPGDAFCHATVAAAP